MVLITVRQLKDGQHSVTCFIDAKWQNDNELKISVLKESTAFTTTVNINSECIKKWSRNLQLTPEQYLSQLYSAMEGCNQQSSEAVRNSDHVFDVQDFCLTWKQYFKDKAVHGKRGNIPLDSVPHSEACWMILESAATEQQQQSLTMREIQSSNERLLADAAAATQLAEKSVKQLTSFKELTYLKFCHLLNSKKEEIRSLHEKLSQMKESDPDGRTTSDVTSFLPNKQRAAQSNQKHKKVPAPIHGSSDDDFDADTDVDEVNTDEEDELTKTSESSALKRKHSHNDNVSSNKRPEPWNFSQETELLNISSGNSECLLSNIRPREQMNNR